MASTLKTSDVEVAAKLFASGFTAIQVNVDGDSSTFSIGPESSFAGATSAESFARKLPPLPDALLIPARGAISEIVATAKEMARREALALAVATLRPLLLECRASGNSAFLLNLEHAEARQDGSGFAQLERDASEWLEDRRQREASFAADLALWRALRLQTTEAQA